MLEWNWSVKCLHHIYYSSLGPSHPIRKVHVVGNSRTEHDESDVLWQHDDGFLPDNASLLIVDVVHLVEDDPLDVSDHLRPSVEVVSQDFSSHDHATCLGVHAHIACYDTD